MSWTAVTTGATPMSSIAVGPTSPGNGNPTAWGISKIASGNDYQIWNYNISARNSWAVATIGGAGRYIAADPVGNVWFTNHNGSVFASLNYAAWTPVQDNLDGGSVVGWYGNITSTLTAPVIAAGTNNDIWLINNQQWHNPSSDFQIFQMVSFNSTGNTAWTLQPGGARSITVSANGVPWIINTAGTVFSGGGGWPGGNAGPLVKTAGAGSTSSTTPERADAGPDGGSVPASTSDSGAPIYGVGIGHHDGGGKDATVD